MVAEVVVEDPGEVGLGAAVRGPVVVGQVEMGDAQVEGSAQDGTLGVDGPVVTEVLPQPKRYGGQEQAAAPTTAIGHGPVAVLGGEVAGHVSLLLRLGTGDESIRKGRNRATGPRTRGAPTAERSEPKMAICMPVAGRPAPGCRSDQGCGSPSFCSSAWVTTVRSRSPRP